MADDDLPIEISFQNMEPSDFIRRNVMEKANKLQRFADRIVGVRVVIDAPHRHHHKGKTYDVRIDISIPGEDVRVTHQGPKDQAHEDVYVAIRDAFDAAVRRLEDAVRKADPHRVKTHDEPLTGTIRSLFDHYGFIDTSDGREIYFHRNSVAEGDFDELSSGDRVRLVVAYDESPHGPQASTVVPLSPHGRA
ncbi:cold-shock DNA-binding protein family [Limimonas halophila]|uniref:Cold-shock DNA-binding protein family n=1 Tax=Limimonas halophila TaxID=1082479 RepID=A0A1G7Q2A6_9PROT|nr:HPF/RaiA family ribosome-associated protein [Limimonas halophila]SDF92702.1 cold-shock DNA-binding protein family [Limimonas halophila]